MVDDLPERDAEAESTTEDSNGEPLEPDIDAGQEPTNVDAGQEPTNVDTGSPQGDALGRRHLGYGLASTGTVTVLAGCNVEIGDHDGQDESDVDDGESDDGAHEVDERPGFDADDDVQSAGRGANAVHEGAFVIGDSSPQTITSKRPNEFRSQMPIYAPAFETTSARAAKTDVEPVEPETVLEGVESLSINTWRFTHGDERHVGPMAEEFQNAFELDGSDDSIATVDADGVVLAAIQGAASRLEERNRRLRTELTELDDTIDELESRIESVTPGADS